MNSEQEQELVTYFESEEGAFLDEVAYLIGRIELNTELDLDSISLKEFKTAIEDKS